MSKDSSPIIDASVSRVRYDPELDDPHLDNHQLFRRRQQAQITYSQEAAHGLIDDYLKSRDALLVQEGEHMGAAEEGGTVIEHRSVERQSQKRAASNKGEGGSDRARRLRRDLYAEIVDDVSSEGGQPRHVNNTNNLPTTHTEPSSFVISGSSHTININTGIGPQTISHFCTPADLRGDRHRNFMGHLPRPELFDADDDAEFQRQLDNMVRRYGEELVARYGVD